MPQEQEQHSVIWPQGMQDESMTAGVAEDDFAKFLDLDPDFQFTGIDHAQSGLDTPMGRLGFGHGQQATMQSLGFNGSQPMGLDMPGQSNPDGFQHHIPTTQQYEPFQQYHHMQIGHNYHVPPTPVSSEMHPGKYGQGLDNNGQIIFDGRQVSFTPLVSPAQTPLHGSFNMPEFGNADDFFSPLTSPALEAQAQFGTGTTASPVDLNTDSAPNPTSALRRGRRKGSMSTRPTGARSVRQSPVVKPMRGRRQQSSTNLSMDKIDPILALPNSIQNLRPHVSAAQARSSDDSVSPEPLSESLMRPPPVPPPTDRSPRALGPVQTDESGNPVTPSTLMRILSKQQASGEDSNLALRPIDDIMEDIMLPAAAAPTPGRSPLPELDTSIHRGEDDAAPILSAKSAKISANSTPRSALPKNNSQDSFSKPARVDGRGGRGSKKRQSTSSAAISPALRPKISPSISPLVPASGPGMSHISAETSALYLASKSNYQNIIDGTHLPGVSYPEALAENLSSKRTSHKIAEQGRRNRINLALKEIEGLLPASITAAINKREKNLGAFEIDNDEKGSASAQGASKASTVEMAIVYIRSLQAELQATRDKLESVEKKLAAGSSSAGSQHSTD